jgi:hypothetical protein
MRKLTKYALISVAVGLLLGTSLLFPGLLLKGIIEPIATVLWAAWRVVTSVDQGVYWGALIVGYMMLMIRFLPRETDDAATPDYRHGHQPRTQVERWQAMLKDANVGDEESATLRDSLQSLLASTIGQDGSSNPDELKQELSTKRISLSLAAHQYLFPATTRTGRSPDDPRASGTPWTPRWLRRLKHGAADLDRGTIDELLRQMESIMEITHVK